MTRQRFGPGAALDIARHIHPTAYNEYEKWSSDIFEHRLKARLAAQAMMREEPDKAKKILAQVRVNRLIARRTKWRPAAEVVNFRRKA